MKIAQISFIRAMKRADEKKSCFIFVHSHPAHHPNHSCEDDVEEAKLFRTAHARIKTRSVHGSLVFTNGGLSSARVWLESGTHTPIERARIIGRRFGFRFQPGQEQVVPEFSDRQVRAFGPDIQLLPKRLRVGVIGVGGTASCVTEQLIRLGVGSLLIADGERFESSNVNRVYGSRVIDAGMEKVKLAERRTNLDARSLRGLRSTVGFPSSTWG